MTDLGLNMEVKENKASVEMLKNKLNALIKILEKEGVTTNEEVESLTKEIIKNEST